MAVSASVVFGGKPTLGVISHAGFAMEQKGKDVLTSLDQNLFYEPNSGAVMLRPDLELKSMGGSSPSWTDGDASAVTATGGSWELVTMPGMPELKLLHQKDTTASEWSLVSTSNFGENQGFLVYWLKHVTSSDLDDSSIWFAAIKESYSSIWVKIHPREKIDIYRIYDGITTHWEREIPINFLPTDSQKETTFLVGFYVGDYLILGINGLENTLAIKIQGFEYGTDANGNKYPVLTSVDVLPPYAGSRFEVWGSGAGVFGFRRMKYSVSTTTPPYSGKLISPYFMPGVSPSASTVAKITKSIQPTGSSILGAFSDGKPVELEGVGGSGALTGRIRYGFIFRGNGNVTPYAYNWRIKDPLTRITADGSTQTLTSDVLYYREDITGNKDGSFGDWTSNFKITCYSTYYDTVFTSRNAKMVISLNPGTGATQRCTHFADTLTVNREDLGTFELEVAGQSVVKRLKLTPILRAESFDDRSWRHGDLMKYLCYNLGGVTIVNSAGSVLSASDYSSDPLLPISQEKDRANWQFNPGTSIWDAMNTVREYSGWALYPDNSGQIVYKAMPTSAADANWTIAIGDVGLNVKYTIGDLARTRFMVLGQAGSDDSAGRFKKGDGLLVYKTNSTLETEMGESRPLWIFDPALSSVAIVNKMCNQLYDYYTSLHKIISFNVTDFKAYKTMQLYQVLSITDSKVPDVDGKYLITGIHISADPSIMSGSIEAISL